MRVSPLVVLMLLAEGCIVSPVLPPREGASVERVSGAFISVGVTMSHVCALRQDRGTWCWGQNLNGELAAPYRGNVEKEPVKAGVPPLATIAVGYRMTCGLASDGELFCWGVLSPNLQEKSGPTPRAIGGDLRFTNVAAGRGFVCGVDFEGTAWCWGSDSWTALGHETGSSSVPTKVATTAKFRQIAAGADDTSDPHTCGVTVHGGVICWGSNRHGEASGPSNTEKLGWRDQLPREVPLPVTATSVFVGGHQTCALDDSGAAWCWGDNMHGALGVKQAEYRCGQFWYEDSRFEIECAREPVPVETELRFTTMAMGRFHTCGLTGAGEVWCWGSGRTGTLPPGKNAEVAVPRAAPSPGRGARYTSLAAGEERTCATTDREEVLCWQYRTRTMGDLSLFNWTSGYFLAQALAVLFFSAVGFAWGSTRGTAHAGARTGAVVGIIVASLMFILPAIYGLMHIR